MQYILHGGGIDSTLLFTTLLDQFKDPITLIHIDYGHRAARAELKAIKEQANLGMMFRKGYKIFVETLKVEDVPPTGLLFTGDLEDSPEIPDRNATLIRHAFKVFPDMASIWIGADPVPEGVQPMEDCTPKYFENLVKQITEERNKKLSLIMTPFLYLSYTAYEDLLRRYINHPQYGKLMAMAMTCWDPTWEENIRDMHCGKCAHCKKYERIYGYQFN